MSYAKKFIDWLYTKHDISLNHIPLDESQDFVYCLALLFKLASQDGDTSPEETAQILEIVKPDARLRMNEAMKLMQEGFKKASVMQTEDLLGFIKDALQIEQKKELLEMLYLLLRADKSQHSGEHSLVQKFVKTSGISEEDHAEAYAKALERKAESEKKNGA